MSKNHAKVQNTEEIWAPFTRNLRYYMIDRGLRQEDLAKMVNTGQATVSTWVIGKRAPSMDSVYKIQKALNVSFDDLFRDHNSPDVQNMQMFESYIWFFRSIFPNEPDIQIPKDYVAVCDRVLSSALNDRDRKVVEMRFGLNGNTSKSYVDIGDYIGTSRQRAEQIVHRSLITLRKYRRYFENPQGPVTKEKNVEQTNGRNMQEQCYSAVKELLDEAEMRLDTIFGVNEEQKQALENICSVPIEAADFEVRTYNQLHYVAGINTIGEMLDVDDTFLMNQRGFGTACLCDLHEKQNEILSDPVDWLNHLESRYKNTKEDA